MNDQLPEGATKRDALSIVILDVASVVCIVLLVINLILGDTDRAQWAAIGALAFQVPSQGHMNKILGGRTKR